MFAFTRVLFWVPIFDPQPNDHRQAPKDAPMAGCDVAGPFLACVVKAVAWLVLHAECLPKFFVS